MNRIKIAYFGSPDFSADFLEKLIKDSLINQYIEVKLIVSQPDKLVGRKQILTPTPVKRIGQKYQIPILNNLNSEDKIINSKLINLNSRLKNVDIALVYAYADIIPKELLDLPKYGFWCIHPSLLPKYRGASPIAAPLINGDKTTGATIIKMDDKIDHGPIIAQESLTIENTDKRPDLEKKLTDLAFKMFKDIIIRLQPKTFNIQPKPQDHHKATYTKKLTKQDGFIPFKNLKNLLQPTTNHQSLVTFYNLFRGLYPWPGLWTILPNGKRLKITNMSPTASRQPPITKVQLEGKKEVDFETFNKAYKIF